MADNVQRNIARQQQSQYGANNGMRAPGTQGFAPHPQGVGGQSPVMPNGQIKPQASPSLGGWQSPSPSPQVQQPFPGQSIRPVQTPGAPQQMWAQQQPAQPQQLQGYQAAPMQAPQSLAPVQQAVQQAVLPLYGEGQINQMKAANRDEAIGLQKQLSQQGQQMAQNRGMTGGTLQNYMADANQKAISAAITGNRAIDLQTGEANRNALLQGAQLGLQTAESERASQQQLADEGFRGFSAQLPVAELGLNQQKLNADIGAQNAQQALSAWKAQQDVGLGYAGLETDLTKQQQQQQFQAGESAADRAARLGEIGAQGAIQQSLAEREAQSQMQRLQAQIAAQGTQATQAQQAEMARLQTTINAEQALQQGQQSWQGQQNWHDRQLQDTLASKQIQAQMAQLQTQIRSQEGMATQSQQAEMARLNAQLASQKSLADQEDLRIRQMEDAKLNWQGGQNNLDRNLQNTLGMAGIDVQREGQLGSQAVNMFGHLIGNEQANNQLGYQYTALSAAQQQALLNAILGR